MAEKITAPRLRSMKERGEKIVCVTAYDAYFGSVMDDAGVDLILVGDSLGNTVLGYDSTLPVTLGDMVYHTAAVRRGVSRSLLIADLPFGSYQSSTAQCVDSAVELVKAGAEGVKLEGAYVDEIEALVKAGIPVMGHIGFTPQSVNKFGGHRVQGKGDSGAELLNMAKALEGAGAFSVVLELMPYELAYDISRQLRIPTIGIGAGAGCDGQIQVMHDILGFTSQRLKHAKRYMEGGDSATEAIRSYAAEVRANKFPTSDQSF